MPHELSIEELEHNVWRITDPGYAQPSHAYLLPGNDRAALIDSGTGIWDLHAAVNTITDLEIVVLQTHAHHDHAGASHLFDLVMAHPNARDKLLAGWQNMELRFDLNRYFSDRKLPQGIDTDMFSIPGCGHVEALENRGVVDLGERQLDVFFTPGHSPDSVCFLDLEHGQLFTGDTVIKGRIAVEDATRYMRSLGDLVKLAELSNAVYPAHGESPIEPTFIRRVRQGLQEAITGRAPSGFLAGFATYQFEEFGIMLPPRHRRER